MHSAVDFVGENGVSLQEAWRDGAEAYRGVCTTGFPELLHALRAEHQPRQQLDHLHGRAAGRLRGDCIDKLLTHELRAMTVNAAAQRRYNACMQDELAKTVWVSDCESWYKNAAGKVVNNWPRSVSAYAWHLRGPDFADFDMRA
jgi:hypothetical protein